MEVALYVRVSTDRQQQTQTIEQQIERLQAHVAQQPHWHLTPEHIYRDDGLQRRETEPAWVGPVARPYGLRRVRVGLGHRARSAGAANTSIRS